MWANGCAASEVKRIRPSGVQPRTVELAPRNVTLTAGPPVAGMQYTSGWCSSRLVKATCCPSGDRAGWLTSDRLAVSRRAIPARRRYRPQIVLRDERDRVPPQTGMP